MSASINAVASSSKLSEPIKSSKKAKHSQPSISISHQPNGTTDASSKKHKHKRQKHGQTTQTGALGEHGSQTVSTVSKDKHKDRSSRAGPFEHRRSRMRMSIAPKYAGDYLVGVREQLDGMIMRYVPQMSGVLLAHWDHTFLDETVKLINECPFGVSEVEFEAIVWSPKVGQKLSGTHSLSSPSHLSLLFGRTFNISIPLQHIPTDLYEFEPTNPDDLDSEDDTSDSESVFGGGVDGAGAFGGLGGIGGDGKVEEVGRWKVKKTGKMVGQGGKSVKFTVIGMQVSNQMLSLTGSLLSDPTNPPPPPTIPAPVAEVHRDDSPVSDDGDGMDETEYQTPVRPANKQRISKFKPSQVRTPQKVANAPPKPISTPSQSAAGADSRNPLIEKAVSVPSRALATEPVADQFLSQRELKQKRKEEEKRKREARKERKEAQQLEVEEIAGGRVAVDMAGVDEGDEADHGAEKKKRKSEGASEKKSKKPKF